MAMMPSEQDLLLNPVAVQQAMNAQKPDPTEPMMPEPPEFMAESA